MPATVRPVPRLQVRVPAPPDSEFGGRGGILLSPGPASSSLSIRLPSQWTLSIRVGDAAAESGPPPDGTVTSHGGCLLLPRRSRRVRRALAFIIRVRPCPGAAAGCHSCSSLAYPPGPAAAGFTIDAAAPPGDLCRLGARRRGADAAAPLVTVAVAWRRARRRVAARYSHGRTPLPARRLLAPAWSPTNGRLRRCAGPQTVTRSLTPPHLANVHIEVGPGLSLAPAASGRRGLVTRDLAADSSAGDHHRQH